MHCLDPYWTFLCILLISGFWNALVVKLAIAILQKILGEK